MLGPRVLQAHSFSTSRVSVCLVLLLMQALRGHAFHADRHSGFSPKLTNSLQVRCVDCPEAITITLNLEFVTRLEQICS